MESDLEQDIWAVPTTPYPRMATMILNGKDPRLATIPLKYVYDCFERERERVSNGPGHGHCDFKQ